MDSYKLTYFNLRGIVEPIRLLFKYVDVPLSEHQVDYTVWEKIKKGYKNSVYLHDQLPIFEYNGKILTQSIAIGSFLGRKFNLTPEDSWHQAKCDEVVGAIHDLRIQIKQLVLLKITKNMDEYEKLKKQLMNTVVPLFLENFNEILQENRLNGNSGNMILGGVKPTWADFSLAHFTDQWTLILDEPNLLNNYPLLKKQQECVYNLPEVAKYIANRQETAV